MPSLAQTKSSRGSASASASASASSQAPAQSKLLQKLGESLRDGGIAGPDAVSVATARALRSVVLGSRETDLSGIERSVRQAGAWLERYSGEQAIANTTLRVLHLLHEEAKVLYTEREGTEASQTSRSALSSHSPVSGPSNVTPAPTLGTASPSSGPARPALSAFRPGSTFSIADLVAAGIGASQSGISSNAVSGSATPIAGQVQALAGLEKTFSGLAVGDARDHSGEARREIEQDEQSNEDESEEESEEEEGEVQQEDKGNGQELKALLSQAILELIDELGEVDANIARDARDHIHSGEIILTIGNSTTTEAFLKAAKDRHFTVIVAEGAPSMSGHALARSLSSSANLSVLLIPDCNVHALMPRVSKVIISPHAVLPNGALLCAPGSALACSIARERSVPIVALAGLHRLSANWDTVGSGGGGGGDVAASAEQATPKAGAGAMLDLIMPREYARLREETKVRLQGLDGVNQPDLIITNTGEHPAAFVYRLIKENYRVDV